MRSPRGQASVELVALLPLLALAAAGLVQVALLGHASWAAAQAASAAARAHAVGGDARAAARRELPAHLEGTLRVMARGGGDVEVRLRAPSLVPALDVGTVTARGHFAEQA